MNSTQIKRFLVTICLTLWSIIFFSSNIGAAQYYYYNIHTTVSLLATICINDNGQVVGSYKYDGSKYHAFLWTITEGLRDLGTFGGWSSGAYGINNKGQVVGQAQDSQNSYHPFIWTAADGMKDFLPRIGSPYSINNYGQAAGNIPSGSYSHAAFWSSSGNITDLGTFGGANSFAYGINDFGVIVGSAGLPGGIGQAFSWTEQDGMKNLGSLLGSYSGVARATNNNGQIVGVAGFSSYSRPFLLTPESPVLLLGGNNGGAYGINNQGQVVGSAGIGPSGQNRAFIWTTSKGMEDLNLLTVNLPSGITLNDAYSINNSGQIVGNGSEGAFMLTPKVEAASFIFPVLGISITDPLKNKNDPLQDGWAGKGVGQVSATVGHLGQDYYLKSGDSADKPVYAIAKGEVVEVMNGPGKYGWCDDSDHGWGPVVVIKHTDDNGFKVSDNAIIALGNCGTDRNPKVIYSLYGHLSKESIKDISVGQTIDTGDIIGVIGTYLVDIAPKEYNWTSHLHFEIKDETGFLEGSWYISHPGQCPGSAAQSCGAQGIGTGYSHLANFAPHRYIPSVFIVENQGRKAHIQGVINLLISD